jgi:hypothetical protein
MKSSKLFIYLAFLVVAKLEYYIIKNTTYGLVGALIIFSARILSVFEVLAASSYL